jgi:mannose-6-phosphate isomerase-like protein (cupin superfamily)
MPLPREENTMSTNLHTSRLERASADVGGTPILADPESPWMSAEEISSGALGLRVRRDTAGSSAEVGRAHVQATQGGNGGPLHIHLHQEERFIVHSGVLLVRRGREQLRVGPGEDVRVPAKVAHTFEAEIESTFTVEFRPNLRVWEFFSELFALPTGKRGNPRIGDLARLARAYPEEFLYLPHVPIRMQRALAVPFSNLGSPHAEKRPNTSHPDPNGPPDHKPIEAGEVWENPVTGERATILELPSENREGRVTAELTALAGAHVVGEHLHPAIVERFTVLEGELTVKREGQASILRQGETAVIDPGVWHDWWNATDRHALVRVEITPGHRFAHMVETLFGLARLGHTNAKGMPNPLQLALIAQEFSDVVLFRTPPPALQRALFSVLAPIARRRGYRATYPQLSRSLLTPGT